MKIIEELSDFIEEEIGDAQKYAKMAVKLKAEYPTLAKTFYELSTEEMRHMQMLHDSVTKVINEYKMTHGEPPAAMMTVYEYLHKKQIEHAAQAKHYQSMYNGT